VHNIDNNMHTYQQFLNFHVGLRLFFAFCAFVEYFVCCCARCDHAMLLEVIATDCIGMCVSVN